MVNFNFCRIRHRRLTYLGALLVFSMVFIHLNYEHLEPTIFDFHLANSNTSDGSQVTCKFLRFDPFSPVAMKHFTKYPTVTCSGLPVLTYYDGKTVWVNQTLKHKYVGNSSSVQCRYRTISHQVVEGYVRGQWQGPFANGISVQGSPEFVEVKCTEGNFKSVSTAHHYAIKELEREKGKPAPNTFQTHQMNVLLICLDSISSYLFKRAMPLTREVLVHTLGAVEFNMYNKGGSNTFPNLLTILTGLYESDFTANLQKTSLDKVPFIWKDFKRKGYRTQYLTDRADFLNFSNPPTDSFSSPMGWSIMQGKIPFNNNCFESQIEVKLWLDLCKEFALDALYTTGRFFSFVMMNRPTHDFPNEASAVDEHHADFLRTLHKLGILNNTLLVYFGDHGPRAGSYRSMYEGSIEERSANMLVYVPPWFRQQRNDLYNNLRTNADRLTTNVDIHLTLKHVLKMGFSPTGDHVTVVDSMLNAKHKPRAVSLFDQVSPQRTCDDAQLSPHLCMCYGAIPLAPTQNSVALALGHHVIKDINRIIAKAKGKCAPVRLQKVSTAYLLSGTLNWTGLYRIMLMSEPGNATFEATVRYRPWLFNLVTTQGQISRTSTYKGLSDCVEDDTILRMYCYCKDLLK